MKMRLLLILAFAALGLVSVNCVSQQTSALERQQLEEGEYTRHLMINELERSYVLYIPKGLDQQRPAPVILGFHGGASNPRQFAQVTGLNEEAGDSGFVVVYPEGYRRSWNAGDCCGPAQKQGIDDVAFIHAVRDDLAAVVNFDNRRVFATGWSNGGKFVYRLACELADRIAAIAVVGTGLGLTDCRPKRPVPVLHFHGTADTFHPYTGGPATAIRSQIKQAGVPETIQHWVQWNRCTNETQITYKKGDATCMAYTQCKQQATVMVCTIEGMGHQWPGHTVRFLRRLGPGTDDLSATAMLLTFFQGHPMPASR